MIGVGNVDTRKADQIREAGVPDPDSRPDIPAVGPGFVVADGEGSAPAARVPRRALHELYRRKRETLRRAYHGREQAKRARAAELEADPPEPEDISIRFWRIDSASEGKATDEKEGTR